MFAVPVFAAERVAGLERAVASSGRLALASQALPCPTPPEPARAALAQVEQAKGTNLQQADLYYLKSVLASTGLNGNDDFFDRAETWAARKTPEDKPFNYEHRQDDIIGHITECLVAGVDGKTIPDDTPAADLPDKFHVLTTAVLYRTCDVPDRQKRIDTTLAEIAQGKWYVSMECLFRGFDYLLVPQSSASAGGLDFAAAKLVERSDKTAFLTKHLRAYGGKGEWQGQKVARVLRNILFHGKGLVRKPANPESVIYPLETSGAATWHSTSAAAWEPRQLDPRSQVERDVHDYFGVEAA